MVSATPGNSFFAGSVAGFEAVAGLVTGVVASVFAGVAAGMVASVIASVFAGVVASAITGLVAGTVASEVAILLSSSPLRIRSSSSLLS
jgi:tetrahydromethanopterin S-methyltransferase subunit F